MMPVSAQVNEEERLARTVRIGRLLEIYGALLTERQREFVRFHYHEDLSFGEIARDHGVSRQAVHDAVRQAEAAMEHYEAGLGLLARSGGGQAASVSGAFEAAQERPAARIEPVIEKLDALRRRLATQGVIYDVGNYVRTLDEVIGGLRKQSGGQ
jgi:predicted DNA-binding protein YlxM (UPF0122 family)